MAVLSYNGQDFQENSCWFTINRRAEISRTGRRMYVHHQWVINGRVSGATPAAVDAKVVALENNLVDGGNLSFSLGSYSLLSADCVEGTHVRHFSWLPGYDGAHGSGAECILRRTFRLVIDGKIAVTADTDIVEWHETIRGMGTGGPTTKPVRSLAGTVQAQQVEAVTEYYAIQSGYGIGLRTNPSAATPIWFSSPGVYYVPEKVVVELSTPQNYGINLNTRFKTAWSYTCWSTVPLIASPTGF